MLLDDFAWPDNCHSSANQGLSSPNSNAEPLKRALRGHLKTLTICTLFYAYRIYSLELEILGGCGYITASDSYQAYNTVVTFHEYVLFIYDDDKIRGRLWGGAAAPVPPRTSRALRRQARRRIRDIFNPDPYKIPPLEINTLDPKNPDWADDIIMKHDAKYPSPNLARLHKDLGELERKMPSARITELDFHRAMFKSFKACHSTEKGYSESCQDEILETVKAIHAEITSIIDILSMKHDASKTPLRKSGTPGSSGGPDPEIVSTDDCSSDDMEPSADDQARCTILKEVIYFLEHSVLIGSEGLGSRSW